MKIVDVRYYQKQIGFLLGMVVTTAIMVLATMPFCWTTVFCIVAFAIQLLEVLHLVLKQKCETRQAIHYYE